MRWGLLLILGTSLDERFARSLLLFLLLLLLLLLSLLLLPIDKDMARACLELKVPGAAPHRIERDLVDDVKAEVGDVGGAAVSAGRVGWLSYLQSGCDGLF